VDATAAARRRAQDLRERADPGPARLLEEAAESAGEIAQHLAAIVERLAEAAAEGRPIDAQVRAFRAAADTAVAAATPLPGAASGAPVTPLRRPYAPRVRVLAAVLTAFDLADAGHGRDEVAEYLGSRQLGDHVLEAILAIAFDAVSG
jgi:hypothetical protein